MTTLFSLISLGHTPNLEQFWKLSSSRFPANLIFNSTLPNPASSFSFPLYSTSHACFLIGFYNNRSAPQQPSNASTPVAAPSPAIIPPAKRGAPPETASTNKKQKLNTPIPVPAVVPPPPLSLSAANAQAAVQQYMSAQAQAQGAHATKQGQAQVAQQAQARAQADAQAQAQAQAMTAQAEASALLQAQQNTQRAQQAAQQQSRPPNQPLPPGPNTTNENLQQYINEMKANASRQGAGTLNLADVQAAMANYNAGAGQIPPSSTFNPSIPPNRPPSAQPPQQQLPGQPNPNPNARAQQLAIQQQAEAQRQAALVAQIRQQNLTPQQINALPQLPLEMRQKIEVHFTQIRAKVASGQINQEEANAQTKRLQEFATTHRITLAQKQMAERQNQQAAQAAQAAANRQRAAQQQASQSNPNQYGNQAPPNQQFTNPAPVGTQGQQFASTAATYNQLQAQQIQQQQQQLLQQQQLHLAQKQNAQNAQQRAPTQDAVDLQTPIWRGAISWQDVKFPSAFRISTLIPLNMSDLQDMAIRHTLPAVSIRALPSDSLRPELREKLSAQSGGHGNEELYTMFAQSMEHRSHVRSLRQSWVFLFSLVLAFSSFQCGVIKFGEAHNIGMVIVSIPKQGRLIGIVFTKIEIPEHWLNNQVGSLSRPVTRGPAPPQAPPPANAQQQQFLQMQQLQQQQQQQQIASQQFNNGGSMGGNLSMEQLQNLLGPEQFAQLLANQQSQQGPR
ncbi:hypothetical protein P7C70_g8721, partial [Phenoliferia sp. Uapishka_3]